MVKLRAVHKTYIRAKEELLVLQGIELLLEKGETCAIRGESGCGKTTLLSLIGGLEAVSKGSISVAGHELSVLSESRLDRFRSQTVGFVFQLHLLLEDFSALENVMIPAILCGMDRRLAKERATELLAFMDLEQRARHLPSELSGGECQRVAVARALMNDPELILADEPTGSLDAKNAQRVIDLLFSLVSRFQKTMMLVTHSQSISAYADHQYCLEAGVLQPR